jgi:hypothetical protein
VPSVCPFLTRSRSSSARRVGSASALNTWSTGPLCRLKPACAPHSRRHLSACADQRPTRAVTSDCAPHRRALRAAHHRWGASEHAAKRARWTVVDLPTVQVRAGRHSHRGLADGRIDRAPDRRRDCVGHLGCTATPATPTRSSADNHSRNEPPRPNTSALRVGALAYFPAAHTSPRRRCSS